MKLLMHTCCAPCSVMCIADLRARGIEPTLYWYNPNIHPYTEYRERRNTLEKYAKDVGAELIVEDEYGLRKFIDEIYPEYDSRCGKCYKLRLEQTAKYAAENGFDTVTTTLFVSPYQNHELITKVGTEECEKYKVAFSEQDFRPFFRQGQQIARENGLYMQKYCGCIFSEEDRYRKKSKKKEEQTK